MNQNLQKKINLGHTGHIYATHIESGQINLVRVGSYNEVRHRYNQMSCLIGAKAMRTLSRTPGHSRSAPPGSWFDHYDPTYGDFTDAMVLSAACQPPNELSDRVGYLAWGTHWPLGLSSLSGMKNMERSMSEVGNVFYGYQWHPTVAAGGSAETSAVKRVKEALDELKREGREVYQEAELLQFMKLLTTAKSIHFFHTVPSLA